MLLCRTPQQYKGAHKHHGCTTQGLHMLADTFLSPSPKRSLATVANPSTPTPRNAPVETRDSPTWLSVCIAAAGGCPTHHHAQSALCTTGTTAPAAQQEECHAVSTLSPRLGREMQNSQWHPAKERQGWSCRGSQGARCLRLSGRTHRAASVHKRRRPGATTPAQNNMRMASTCATRSSKSASSPPQKSKCTSSQLPGTPAADQAVAAAANNIGMHASHAAGGPDCASTGTVLEAAPDLCQRMLGLARSSCTTHVQAMPGCPRGNGGGTDTACIHRPPAYHLRTCCKTCNRMLSSTLTGNTIRACRA